jgi:hypothetical protein
MAIRKIEKRLKRRRAAASPLTSPEEGAGGDASMSLAPTNLYDAIRARIARLGGVELDIPPREPMPPVDFT